MSESEFEKLFDSFNDQFYKYACNWGEEAIFWHELGVYNRIAENIDVQEGDSHIDIGSGLGNLLIEINKRQPNSKLIGVDINPTMVQRSPDIIHRSTGAKVIGYDNAGYRIPGNGVIELKHNFNQKFFRSIDLWELLDEAILIIRDDIRTKDILKELFKGPTFDSGSFTFPGATKVLSYCTPYRIDKDSYDEEKMKWRVSDIIEKVRQATFSFMAEHIKPKGRFVYAERVFLVPGREPEPLKTLKSKLKENIKYWESAEVNISSFVVRKEDSELIWHVPEVEDIQGEIELAANIAIYSLQRNDVPFEE